MKNRKLTIVILVIVIILSLFVFAKELSGYLAYESTETKSANAFTAAEAVLTRIGEFFGWIEITPGEADFEFPQVEH